MYKAVLVSGIQQIDSVIHIVTIFYTLFLCRSHYRVLSRVPLLVRPY